MLIVRFSCFFDDGSEPSVSTLEAHCTVSGGAGALNADTA
jgi:hypothetical protein